MNEHRTNRHSTVPSASIKEREASEGMTTTTASPRRGCVVGGMRTVWSVLRWLWRHRRLTLGVLLLTAVALGVRWVAMQWSAGTPLFRLEKNGAIDRTPEEVRLLSDIGQWEFLAVETEELVEAHDRGILGDRHLVRIYRGTLRLGVDLSRCDKGWFSANGSTAMLRLPDVALLDESFIDEARSTTFYEKGSWSAAEKDRLFRQAQIAMKARALNAENLKRARENAQAQFQRIFTALGYEKIIITFSGVKTTAP